MEYNFLCISLRWNWAENQWITLNISMSQSEVKNQLITLSISFRQSWVENQWQLVFSETWTWNNNFFINKRNSKSESEKVFMQHFNTIRSWSYLRILEQIEKLEIEKDIKEIAQNKCVLFGMLMPGVI